MKKYTEERPWGKFERFTDNEESTVKIITVNAGEEFSLQYHKNRDEFWRILEGEASVVVGEKKISAKQGDEFYIKAGDHHRLRALLGPVVFLEISFGRFDENDIVRLEDKYGRK